MSSTETDMICAFAQSRSLLVFGNPASSRLSDELSGSALGILILERLYTAVRHY
jgi:hypothetical protein